MLLAMGSYGRVLGMGMSWAEVSFRKTDPVLSGLVRECWASDLNIYARYNF